MRIPLAICYLLSAVCSFGADVLWESETFTGTPLSNRLVYITPIANYSVSGSRIISGDRQRYTNDATGSLIVSNVAVARRYRVEFIGPYITTIITNSFPAEVTGYVNAADFVDGQVNDGRFTAYSKATADLRFHKTSAGSSTNATFRGTVKIPEGATVGYVFTVTNADGSGAWQPAASGVDAGLTNQWQSDAALAAQNATNKLKSDISAGSVPVAGTAITGRVNLSGSNNITGLLTVNTNQSAITNSAAVLGWGGLALSSVIYGDSSPTANWRAGIHWYPPGWDTVLAPPDQQAIDAWDSAIRSVRHWGGSPLLMPTLHFATKGSLRIEPGFGATDYYGQYYWSFGNEDANTQMRINYTTMTYKRSGTNMSDNAPYQGYGLPLRFEAVHRIGGLNAFSSPGIWGRFADTNAGYASEYSGKDAYLGELWFMARTPANDTTNGTIGIQKPDYGVLSGRMLTNGWDFRGRTMNEQLFVTVTTDTNVPLNFERAKFQTIDLNTITTNLFYTTNVIAISSFTNIYGNIHSFTNAEEKEFRIRAGALDRYLKWPSGWAVDSALPTRLTNQTQLFLRLTAWGAGETNITVSAWRILTDSAFAYDSDAQAFFTAASISDATQKGAVDYLVKARKAANLWTNAVWLCPMVGGASNAHAVNLKSPSLYPVTYTSSGVTHDANGITGNGSSGYGTIATMGTMLGSQGVTNCSVIVYCKTTAPTDAGRFIGATDGTGRFGLARNTASLGVEGPMNLNGPTSYDNLSSDFTGFLAVTRDGSDANRFFTGTRLAITQRSALATAMPTGNMLVLARMASGSPSSFTSANLAYAEIGYGYSSNGLYQLRTIINNFQTILGRQ